MFGFLGFIVIIILVVLLFAIAVLGNLVRFIFGLGKTVPKRDNQESSAQSRNDRTSERNTYASSTSNNKKKIFGEDEGEYVEYEEID